MESLEKFEFEVTPNIEFLDSVAVISRLTVRNSDAVELLRKMDALEVEYLVDSLLTTVAKVAEGTATAEAIMKEFREQIQVRTREEFENFRKEMESKLKSFSDAISKDLKQLVEDSFRGINESDEKLDKKIEKVEEKLREKLEEILKKVLVEEKEQEVKEKHGNKVENIILFGSYARGDYQEESNVDDLILRDAPLDELVDVSFPLAIDSNIKGWGFIKM